MSKVSRALARGDHKEARELLRTVLDVDKADQAFATFLATEPVRK